MNDLLLIKPKTKLMERLTIMSGNVDLDKLTPSIWIAQNTDIERILTRPLYDKILTDYNSNSLSGDYLNIYNDYVGIMLVFFTMGDFIMKHPYMISNGGIFKHQPNNSSIPDTKETDRLSKHYRQLGADFELKFYEFMKDKNIPEYKRFNDNNNSFKFGWQL